ncbi:vitelline membrane outer layer protein 1-like [Ctenopharyngodon idella]|uniref:vitelline membrane outer layer protein 1-like n=1 Tax=Ctenopharyngodon idella TaxID=7959 RepID=UPI002231DCFD|nr:vitelline membrane outer layer protein 1-like [Ctenopharyngodon idella]
MHHFFSIAFSLLSIFGLHVSVQSTERRSERSIKRNYNSLLTVPNGMEWGSWGFKDMCSSGMYAAGFSLKVEPHLYGIWDDNTALNGIRLHCVHISSSSRPHRSYTTVQSHVGSWGEWTDIKWCPAGFLTTFQLRVESSQGIEDDTAANNIRFKCSEGSLLVGDGTSWGKFGDWSRMCEGRGICGIKTRVEESQGIGDDTALNDVQMYCCD